MTDTPTDAEMIAAVKRAIGRLVDWPYDLAELATMRAVIARLEGLAAPAMTDTPATPDPQPTREVALSDATLAALVECERTGRHYSDGEGKMVIEISTTRLMAIVRNALDRFAAQHSTAATVSGGARERATAMFVAWWSGEVETTLSVTPDKAIEDIAAALTAAEDKARREAIGEAAVYIHKWYDQTTTTAALIRALARTPERDD